MDEKKKDKKKQEQPVTVNITNNNQFQKGVGAFITNLNHLTIVMDSEGNMKMDAVEAPVMPHTEVEKIRKELDKELLTRAIENCQQYFWGNASYAVVFCICRDDYKKCFTRSDFEEMIEQLPYKHKRSYSCPAGTIANAFSDNPIYNEDISEWDKFNPLKRITKLRDELRKELYL